MATGENRFHSTERIWTKPRGETVFWRFYQHNLDLLLSFNSDAQEEFQQRKLNTLKGFNQGVIS